MVGRAYSKIWVTLCIMITILLLSLARSTAAENKRLQENKTYNLQLLYVMKLKKRETFYESSFFRNNHLTSKIKIILPSLSNQLRVQA